MLFSLVCFLAIFWVRMNAESRRTFLKLSLGGIAGASLASPLSVLARAKEEAIAITPVTDSIALVTGAGSNVVVFKNDAGVVMIDGGLAERSTFQHGIRQFLDEERHPVGVRENVLHYLLGKRLAPGHPQDQRRAVASVKAGERDCCGVRITRPWWSEFWPGRDQHQCPKLRHLLHSCCKELERGWVNPVYIFENK